MLSKMRVASCIIILISLLSFMQSDAAAAKNKKWKQMKKDLKENISNLEAEFEDLMRLCVDAESDDRSLKEALATSQRLLRLIRNETGVCNNNKNVAASIDNAEDPCTENLNIRFDSWWDNENGNKWYNISLALNASRKLCDPTSTWVQPLLFDDQQMRVESGYEQILALCPPSPDCVPYVTRSYSKSDWPKNNAQAQVELVTNYGGSCAKYNGHSLKLEVKSCPLPRWPDHEVYRLPANCATNVCIVPPHSSYQKKMQKLGLQLIG